MVFVISKTGNPLMPCKPARAKHLLRDSEAIVKCMEPFTIQLTIDTPEHVQPVTMGIDLGAKEAGFAAKGNGHVLYQGEVALRTDIHKRMETRAMYRRSRRGRKCRYRSPRFNNRAASRRKGRLPPSIKSRSDTTIKVARRIAGLLPISLIRVEIANFDTQAMKAGRRLRSWEYQRGEQYGHENVKMYVRARDKYTCQYCGEVRPNGLEVDHIMPRSRGGSDAPYNRCASCHDCNQRKGNQTAEEFGYPEVPQRIKRKRLKYAAHTMQGKTATLAGLAEIAPVETTYGYITKVNRKAMGLPKTHYCDAVAIASLGEQCEPLEWVEKMKAVSRGARQQRRGIRSHRNARLPYEVFGYRMWDKVMLPSGEIGFVGARRKTGSFMIRGLDGNTIKGGITFRKLRLLERTKTLVAQLCDK